MCCQHAEGELDLETILPLQAADVSPGPLPTRSHAVMSAMRTATHTPSTPSVTTRGPGLPRTPIRSEDGDRRQPVRERSPVQRSLWGGSARPAGSTPWRSRRPSPLRPGASVDPVPLLRGRLRSPHAPGRLPMPRGRRRGGVGIDPRCRAPGPAVGVPPPHHAPLGIVEVEPPQGGRHPDANGGRQH